MHAYKALEQHFEKISHLNHLQAIVGWDEAVMMPIGGGPARAKAMATLQGILHETVIHPQIAELIASAQKESLENHWQQANLKWMIKQFKNATCLPADLVKAITEASINCEQAWRVMRTKNNWQDFAPLLQNLLGLIKQSAQIRSEVFGLSPYDMLIDDFSPGMTQAIIDPIFNRLKQILPELTATVIEKQSKETMLQPNGPFAIASQIELNKALMRTIGFDFNHGRLDVSHHPFCGGVAEDVRVTTRYNENEFITSAMGICHETGHAKYEQQLPPEWQSQPVGQANGMSVHESQSLLVEMQACRSQEFMQFLAPLTQQHFGVQAALASDNLYKLYTRVKPGFIRVDADELTYPLHVILRYELEKELIENDLPVQALPDAWNSKMQQYLGLSTKDNFHDGVMQDVHWPSGGFGYFPAYTLGALISAQLYATAKTACPEIPAEISKGHFFSLMQWLKQHIHSKASSVDTQQLLIEATGEPLNPDFFINHVKKRYL